MLVLSTKKLRSVAIEGPNGCHLVLNVTMVELQGGSVRLGLVVSADSPVRQCEVSDRTHASGLPGYATGQAGAP